MRTKRKAIAIIQRSCSDSLVTASQMDRVFGSDRWRAAAQRITRPKGAHDDEMVALLSGVRPLGWPARRWAAAHGDSAHGDLWCGHHHHLVPLGDRDGSLPGDACVLELVLSRIAGVRARRAAAVAEA